jgi:hypothetical protein
VADTSVEAALVAATLVEAALEAVTLAEVTSAALAVPVLGAADFAQLRMGALILPLEVSADQPVRFNTTMEGAACLLLGHTNSADGETNR